MSSVIYVVPSTDLYGGIRVIFEHAEGLADRGYGVTVVGPDPPPDWYELRVPYRQMPVFEPGGVPRAEICFGTFYTTVGPAVESGAPHVFHLCQGFEGVHREYAPILGEIDTAYRLPTTKVLISRHLLPVLRERYGFEPRLIGQFIDTERFFPGLPRADPRPLRIGVVGPFGIRSKGIGEALEGLGMAREAGFELEVHHASALPLSDEEQALGVTDRFHHRLSTDQMVGFYQDLDALVHPSHDEEGFPLPPLEALACGVPVALTRIRPFAVLPDEAVIRYPWGEPEALIPVVEQLTDGAVRKNLRQAGLRCVREDYTLATVLDRLEQVFVEVGAPRPGRGEV